MKKRSQFIPFTIVWILFLVFFPMIKKPSLDIHKVLERKEYSYLPVEAQNYIEKVYEMSGELIRTEKNHEDNVPYLNPKYIEYLTLSSEEAEKVEEVPEVYRVDYTDKTIVGDGLPSSYDLRNVNGKNFLTPLKNQSSLDLCWAFTSMEQAESLLLKNSNTSYQSSSLVFSPRQLDYATSYDGVVNYTNEYGVRSLTKGGNFFMSSMAMSKGIALTKEEFLPFDLSVSQKSYSDVFNYSESQYEVESTISVPTLTSSSNLSSYVSTVKNYIMNYGGAYVSSQAPNKSCASRNADGNIILRVDSSCTQNANHAMQLIGWDDNYEYSYCASNGVHSSNTATCSSSNLVKGKGAWILRNSWGESEYAYVYFAYDSIDYEVDLTTSMSPMSSRNWDNEYSTELDHYYVLSSTTSTQLFKKKIDSSEKVQKVKFYSYGSGGRFVLSITSGKESYRRIKTVTVPNPGIYTIDLSDLNVVITDSSFNVEIQGTNGVYFVKGSISAFTKNIEDTPLLEMDDFYDSSTGQHQHVFYTKTKNVPSGSLITYELYNTNGNNVSNYLTVRDNKVGLNGANSLITISSSAPIGVYSLYSKWEDGYDAVTVSLGVSMNLSGSGTVSNPYLIQSEADLKSMANSLNSHYKLAKDITLTDSWKPIGTKTTPFTGSLDGGGHTIYNMVVDEEYDYSGLFGYVMMDSNNTSFKNLTISNPSVDAYGDAGALIGHMTGKAILGGSSSNCTSQISDISILNGHVFSRYGNAGALIGSISAPINEYRGKHTYNISRIFNSSSFAGTLSSGMIGYVYGYSENNYYPTINMENIENVGVVDISSIRDSNVLFFTGSHASMVGYVLNYAKVNLSQYISTSYFHEYSLNGDGVFGVSSSVATLSKSKGFASQDASASISSFTSSSSYSNWSNFSSNWSMLSVSGIPRIPVLTGVTFRYTSIPTIELHPGDTVSLTDYLIPKMESTQRISTGAASASGIVTLTKELDDVNQNQYDLEITAVKIGSVTIPFTSYYDGSIQSIRVNVVEPQPQKTSIVFFKNDGTEDSTTQEVDYQSDFHLMRNSFSRPGYTFMGWNTQANGQGEDYEDDQALTATFKNLNLYAQWEPITYTIHYDANGGEGSMESVTVRYGDRIYLKKNTFVLEGYKFNGWNTNKDGDGISYVDLESVINLCNTNGAEFTLYAQWKKEIIGFDILEYSVNYDTLYIDDIKIGTSLEEYKRHFTLGDGYTMTIDLGDKNVIYTGSKVKLFYNGTLEGEYTNIVRGDINGDGAVNSGDLFRLRQHLLGVLTVQREYSLAADMNRDNNINSGDLFRLRQHLLGVLLLS